MSEQIEEEHGWVRVFRYLLVTTGVLLVGLSGLCILWVVFFTTFGIEKLAIVLVLAVPIMVGGVLIFWGRYLGRPHRQRASGYQYSAWPGLRRQASFRKHLEPYLNAHGLRFVAEKWPGYFKTEPFPKFQIRKVSTEVNGVVGEFSEFRIVTFQDSEGRMGEVWAKIEFAGFYLRKIRWRAADTQNLPEAARAILEK